MKRNVAKTSTDAYKQHTDNGHIPSIRQKVLEAMKVLRTATKGEIARHLGMAQESIHKRLSEIGLVRTSQTKIDPETKSRQSIWELVETK